MLPIKFSSHDVVDFARITCVRGLVESYLGEVPPMLKLGPRGKNSKANDIVENNMSRE